MVPIADAFNHTNENHVHMESDFDVCVECGSLVECDHDHETLPAVPSRGAYSLPGVCKPDLALEIDTLDMCSVKPILPHSEVFNTYGSLSNAELISRYGFTLPENECDIVSLGYGSFSAFINNLIDVVLHSSADSGNDADMQGRLQIRVRTLSLPTDFRVLGDEREIADDFAIRFLQIYSHLATLWTTEPRWDETGDNGMVYNSPSVSSPRSLRDNLDSVLPEAFNINSEGKLTHTLWLFCVLFATCISSPEIMTNLGHSIFPGDNEPPRQSLVEDVKRYLVDVQNHIDNARETGDDDEEAPVSAWSDTPSDTRDDPYFHVPQSHMMSETDVGGISKDENNVLASAIDSACFISSLRAPTSGSLGLDLPIGIRHGGDACVLAHALTTKVPSAPSSVSQAVVWSGLRRRSNVEEERPQKRLRNSSPHAVVSQEDLPVDISGRVGAINAHRAAQTLALIVIHLCQHRIDSAHVSDVNASNLTAAELGELLDVTPMHMHRTRMAMLLALNEKSILESCASTWGAVLENIHDINKE
ncbi:uncharacterized protein BJ212DRAFT_505922 [Suillus subaureus]|uniref:SET domain-containing protein n=1 Tax=Suillus subaureus TaxID=48587 RepID=A0A9P7JAM2_9AGAM|nr:uncharacterized protein BJ212DRAFT_505922 [Suillus subaureus]KAG1811399.1 hypothetical protein BJ212DRAFT_505922 [Suillus subaureus]